MTDQFFPSYTIGADAYDSVPSICGAFGKTDSDKKSDFHAVYDFEEAFVLPFRCEHD